MKLLCAVLVLLSVTTVLSYKRICYYTNWSQYRVGNGKYTADNVDGSLCDYVVYAFANMINNEMVTLEWNDPTMYQKLNALKVYNPHLKTLISVGGANFDLTKMTSMLATSANRSQFIQSSIAFIKKHNFNGVDLNFEYPGSHGSPPGDKYKFTLFCQEFRAAIQGTSYLLTSAVPAGKPFIDAGYEISKLSAALDYLMIMTFDYNGAWQNVVGIGSPLYPREGQVGPPAEYNVKWTMDYWVDNGADKSKLIVGLPAYARGWKLLNTNVDHVGASADGASDPGEYTKSEGILCFYEVCLAENSHKDFKRMYHQEHKSPYAKFNTNQWISYDDVSNVKMKVNWIKQQGYAGFMFWTLDFDDFNNKFCSLGKYPLLKAASDTIKS